MMGASGPRSFDLVLWVGLGAICLVITAVALWQRTHSGGRRTAEARRPTREQWSRLRDEKELVCLLEDLLARVDEVSRRVSADLESRQSALRALLAEADARIDRLGATAHEAEARSPAAQPRPAVLAQATAAAPRLDERQRRIYELADTNTSPALIADALQMPLGEVELVLNLRRFADRKPLVTPVS